MNYYIVAIDKFSHDEYVHSTHNSVELATEVVESLRAEGSEALEYRVDAIPEKHAVVSTSTNDGWKIQNFEMPEFAGEPEPRRTEFTAMELFPPTGHGYLGDKGTHVPVSDCAECGAYVRIPQHAKHAAWHNKVADL